MISVLVWIVSCYAAAAAVIYVFSTFRLKKARVPKHYVLIAGNEGSRMEWYMRSLRRFSHLTGTDVKVTVVDNGSEDDTLSIARFFARHGMDVQVHSGSFSAAVADRTIGLARREHLDPVSRMENSGHQIPALDEELHSQDSPLFREAGSADIGRSAKWQRFRAIWRWRVGKNSNAAASVVGAEQSGRSSKPLEPTHLLWMLQAEGIVSVQEHAVLIDLRDPADLSKLPF